tara:strand:+ start:1780 stop:3666 length:1887 start_codon:yes stop_codon:yes gene_type:complete
MKTDQLPTGGKLLYNNPMDDVLPSDAIKEAVQNPTQATLPGSVKTDQLPKDGTLLYNSPLDDQVKIPQQEVKAQTTIPALKAEQTTLGGYVNYKLDSMFKNIQQDFSDSKKKLDTAIENRRLGKISDFEMKLSGTASVINFGMDTLGEVVVNVAGAAGDSIGYLVPDDIEEPVKQGFKAALNSVINSPAAQAGLEAIYAGTDAWEEWATNNPRAAENIKSVVDIGVALGPIKGGKAAKAGSVRDDIGKALEDRGNKLYDSGVADSNDKSTIEFLDSFSDKNAKGYQDRTRSIQRVIYNVEQLGIDEAQKLNGYNSKAKTPRAIAKNHVISDKALIQARVVRDNLIEPIETKISNASVFDNITKNLDAAKVDVVDADGFDNAARKLLDMVERSVGINGRTPSGLEQVRKDINTFMEKNVTETERNNRSNPNIAAVNSARDGIKQAIEAVVPGYKEVQDKVIGLTAVKKGVGYRLSEKYGNGFMNLIDDGLKTVGLSRDAAFMLSAIGIGSYGAVATPLLAAAGLGYVTLKTGQFVNKGLSVSQGKKATGAVIKLAAKSLRNAEGNPALIKQIRADRAAVLEIISIARDTFDRGGISEEEEVEDLSEAGPPQTQRNPETNGMVIPITKGI